jgi:hypothetical protein
MSGHFLIVLIAAHFATSGNIVDYVFQHKNPENEISITVLWKGIIYGLQDIWPESRTRIAGKNMGDVWDLAYVVDMLPPDLRFNSQRCKSCNAGTSRKTPRPAST